MKSQISFTTDLFESHDGTRKAAAFGEDLARWVVATASGGEFTFGEPYQEGRGWAVHADAGDEKFVVTFTIADGSIGDDQADWLITVEKERKWKMFSAKDSPMRAELCDLMQNILRDGAHIREIRWID